MTSRDMERQEEADAIRHEARSLRVMLETARVALRGAENALFNSNEELLAAKRELLRAEDRHTELGLDGNNKEAREACLRTRCKLQREAVEECERGVRQDALHLRLAQTDLSAYRAMSRTFAGDHGIP